MSLFRDSELEAIQAAKARWEAALRRRPLPPATTASGIPVAPLYTPDDVAGLDYAQHLGLPGQYPYTRGIYPSMYRGSPWTIREYSGFGTAEDTNARFNFLLAQGLTALSVAFDLPTQLGFDADDPLVEEEVGRVGVAVSTLADVERLFAGIPLAEVSTSFTINATAAVLLAMYVVAGERQGVAAKELRGTLQNDILKEYVARGTWIFPVAPSLRLTADVIEYCARELPRFNSISISAAHMREAGANAVESIAYAFANAIAYIDYVLARGLSIDEFAPRLSFNLGITLIDFFEEIAKYRAARRLWARLMRERFAAQDPRSLMLRFYAGCGGSSLTAAEPLNNVIRVAYEAMAAALGGAQAIHTCSYDEAYAIPTEESVHLALRTQQILAEETGITSTADPLGGSFFVEALTNRMEEEIRGVVEKLEADGGVVAAITSGLIQRRIGDRAYEEERRILSGEKRVVGVNRFAGGSRAEALTLHEPDPATARRQVERVRAVKAARDGQRAAQTLAALGEAAGGTLNLMPFIVDAVRAYASVGEITTTLRRVFGEFQEPATV